MSLVENAEKLASYLTENAVDETDSITALDVLDALASVGLCLVVDEGGMASAVYLEKVGRAERCM